MEDVARLAGVSASTVSRALNHSSLVNQETRERIERLARSLNYSINEGARNLRLQRNRTVAVVVPFDAATRQHISDPFFVSLLGSLADALTDRGYEMLLSRIDADRLDSVGELATSGRALGVILVGQWHSHEQLNDLAMRHIPLVVWGARIARQRYCTVGSDNITGGALATEHLIDIGRRRIAFFGDSELPEVAHRFEGYQRALATRGLDLVPDLQRRVPFTEGSARRTIAEMWDRGVACDAVFAASDLLAMEVISTLRQRGVRVPDDVAVVGYDDIELARYFHPSLTTIRQPLLTGGAALVDALMAIVEGDQPDSQVLPTTLIVRDSSVCQSPQPQATATASGS